MINDIELINFSRIILAGKVWQIKNKKVTSYRKNTGIKTYSLQRYLHNVCIQTRIFKFCFKGFKMINLISINITLGDFRH